jgi:phosphoribosyl-AMP cyclohydrolase
MSTFIDAKSLSHAELEEGTALAPKFDANGLVTAIVQEAGSNRVLMLAHMNAEALELTLSTGTLLVALARQDLEEGRELGRDPEGDRGPGRL